MPDPTDKTRKFLRGASDTRTKGLRGSLQSGAWTVQGPSGEALEVREGADLVSAYQSGADGEVGFIGSDGAFRTIQLSELGKRLGNRLGEFRLASGPDAEKALDAQLFEKLGDEAESRGIGRRMAESANEALPFGLGGEPTLQEDALTEAGAKRMPISTMVGAAGTTLATTAVPGGALVKAAQGAKLATLAAHGTNLLTEAALFEDALARQENRPFSTEAMALDFATGAGAGVLFKILGKGSRHASKFVRARKAEKTRNLSHSSNMAQAKKVTPRNAMGGKLVKGDVGAAAEILRKHGDDIGAAQAEYLVKHADSTAGLGGKAKLAAQGIARRVEEVNLMFDDMAVAWRKNIGKVDASSGRNMSQVSADLAREADALQYGFAPGSAERLAFNKIGNELIHNAKLYQGKGINLAELQEAIHQTSKKFNNVKSDPVRGFLKKLREAKHNPEYFGNAAHQRQAADAALHGWKKAASRVNRLVGTEKKINKLIQGGDPGELLRAGMLVDELLQYTQKLVDNKVPGFERLAKKNVALLKATKQALEHAEGSVVSPGPLRLARAVSEVERAVGRVRVPAVAGSTANPLADAAMGYAMGGMGGAIAGGLGGKFVKQAAFQAAATIIPTIDKGVAKVGKAMANPTVRGATFRALGATSRVFQPAEKKREDYYEVAQALETAAGNPDYFANEMATAVAGLEELEGDAAFQASNAVYYLANQLPKTSTPNPTQIDTFMSQVEMVQDPYAALDHLAAGTFTTPMARTLASIYPKLYGEMIASLAMDMDGKDLTYSNKLELSRFMGGVPLDPLMQPEYQRVLRNRGAQTSGQAAAISSPRNNIMSQRLSQQTQTSASRIANK